MGEVWAANRRGGLTTNIISRKRLDVQSSKSHNMKFIRDEILSTMVGDRLNSVKLTGPYQIVAQKYAQVLSHPSRKV